VNLSIAAASVTSLKPLVSRLVPQLLKGEPTQASIQERRPDAVTSVYSMDSAMSHDDTDMANEQGGGRQELELSLAEVLRASGKSAGAITAILNPLPPSQPQGTAFDFVQLVKSKPATELTLRESIGPLLTVGAIFFVFGIVPGLIEALDFQTQSIGKITQRQVALNNGVYYAGYLVAPLTIGYQTIQRRGYKACFIVGLLLQSVGCLVYWPAGMLY
jgi:hypothetical protein